MQKAAQNGIRDVVQSMDVLWNTIRDFLATNGLQMLINITAMALIFFIGRWVAGVVSNLAEKIKVKLEANGITIPFPQRDIHIRTGQLKV